MDKLLITLSGTTSVGKSTTLNLLWQEIKNNYKCSEIRYYSFSNINNELKNINELPKDKIIVLKNVGGKKLTIGINTAGDSGEIVEESLKLFGQNIHNINCDIVICPTKAGYREDSGSLGVINRFYNNGNEKIRLIPLFKILNDFSKNNKELQNKTNNEMCNIIMNILAKEL